MLFRCVKVTDICFKYTTTNHISSMVVPARRDEQLLMLRSYTIFMPYVMSSVQAYSRIILLTSASDIAHLPLNQDWPILSNASRLTKSQAIILGIYPGRLTGFGSESWTELVDRSYNWNRSKESDDTLRRKSPGPAGRYLPRCKEKLRESMLVKA